MQLKSKKLSKRKKSARLRKSKKNKKLNGGIKVRYYDNIYDLNDKYQKQNLLMFILQQTRPLNDLEKSLLKNYTKDEIGDIDKMFSGMKI